MTSPVSRYAKPFTSIQEQVRILTARGLLISDEAAAEAALRRHGYYRLSGYSHVYRVRVGGTVLNDFVPGASLSDVLKIEQADASLRSLLLDALAVVEVILRFNIGHRLGRRSAFAHRRPQDLGASFTTWKASRPEAGGGLAMSEHTDWLMEYRAQESRSQETFVTHFRSRYGPHLPVWVSTEVMSFGTLSRLYNGMHENDRKLVALRFGVRTRRGEGDSSTFSTWLNHLRYVRNLCAHHGRVWNRNFDVGFGIPHTPELAHLAGPASRRVYGSLAILRYILARVAPDFTSWFDAVEAALRLEQVRGVTLEQMGFPHGWKMQKIWAPIEETDRDLMEIVNSVEAVDVLNTREARQELTVKPHDKARKDWLRYLEAKGAVIAHTLGPQKYYPAFQFSDGDVRPEVAGVNEVLFSSLSDDERASPQGSITVQRWWTTERGSNGFVEAPLRQLEVGPPLVLAAAHALARSKAA